MPFTSAFTALGIDDAINACDCCGKKNLKCTVVLEAIETGAVMHYGRDCAGAALYGRKSAGNTKSAEDQAVRRAKLEKLADVVRNVLSAGGTPSEAVEAGRQAGKNVRICSSSVLIDDYSSFAGIAPAIRLHANGLAKPCIVPLKMAA